MSRNKLRATSETGARASFSLRSGGIWFSGSIFSPSVYIEPTEGVWQNIHIQDRLDGGLAGYVHIYPSRKYTPACSSMHNFHLVYKVCVLIRCAPLKTTSDKYGVSILNSQEAFASPVWPEGSCCIVSFPSLAECPCDLAWITARSDRALGFHKHMCMRPSNSLLQTFVSSEVNGCVNGTTRKERLLWNFY